ncbi:MAG: prenyltransferase [Spongiibacteraceae bacterium]
MTMNHIGAMFKSMRPPFLILTPICILLAYALAYASGASVLLRDLVLVCIGAVSAHIAVNTLNEYQDFRSGLDLATEKTPFSGGSGALVTAPTALNAVLNAAIGSLLITVAVGLYLVVTHGLMLLPIGIAGVLIVVTYTEIINRRPLLCLIAPGVAFGPLMVVGSYYVFAASFDTSVLLVSLLPFFLVNNLLLLNQFPDVAADREVGRRHFAIAFGLENSALVYGLFAALACATIVYGVVSSVLPTLSYFALLPMLAAAAVAYGARKHMGDITRLAPFMALNVLATLLAPAVLALTLFLA